KSGTGDCTYRGADGEARPVANVTHCGEAFYYLWRDIFRHQFFCLERRIYAFLVPAPATICSMFYDRQ
ncbi:TPA: hypothetical protein ACWV75_000535, partial [Salmonella enterica subsp. enterica serovar Muenchen]